MKRRLTAMLLMAVTVTGCSSFSFHNPFAQKKGPAPETLPPSQWSMLKRENAQRLAGDDIPRPGAATRPANEGQSFLEFIRFTFWTFPKQTIDKYLGNTPGHYARMMEDDQSPDVRRTGVLRLVTDYGFARKEPYTDRYWQIAQGDPDTLVRVAGIRALDRSRDPRVVPIAIKALDDPNAFLRLEAAKALANIPDERAIPGLIRHIAPIIDIRAEGGRTEQQQESRDVRVACADALRNFPTKDSARVLVDALREKDFEVSWQARRSLELMTGHDFHYDQGKWRDYFASAPQPFGG